MTALMRAATAARTLTRTAVRRIHSDAMRIDDKTAAAAAAATPAAAAAPAAAQPHPRPARSRTSTPPVLLSLPPETRPPFLFFAAPLEDVSDPAWRRLVYAEGRGADICFSEMARVENLARKATGRSGSSWAKTSHQQEKEEHERRVRAFGPKPNEDSAAFTARHASLEGRVLTPTIVQLLINKEDSLRQFLEAFDPVPGVFAGFNLNFGCPSPDVMKLGLGAQAVKRIAKCQRWVEMLNEYLARNCAGPEWALTQLPAGVSDMAHPLEPMRPGVSIKMRLGANHREQVLGTHINLIRALRGDTPSGSKARSELNAGGGGASSAGPVSFFIVHARHGSQHYEHRADLGAIARTILHTGAPNILANGDIHTSAQVRRCAEMGAAGVMIGRAAVKDPHIFARLKESVRVHLPMLPILSGRPLPEPVPAAVTAGSKQSKKSAPAASSSSVTAPASAQASPTALSELYTSFASAYNTPEKYRENVLSRIGKVFEPNPRPSNTVRARKALEEAMRPRGNNNTDRDDNRREDQQWTATKERGQRERKKFDSPGAANPKPAASPQSQSISS